MIAAATQATHATNSIVDTINHLPFSWFDITLVLVLLFGLFRGRKNGMTKEVIPMFEWLAVVLVCGFGYLMTAQIYINAFNWGKTAAYIFGYLTLAMLVFFLFLFPRKLFIIRLEGSNFFGGSEYYLGMLAGLIRYACIIIFVLALFNAPVYTATDIAAKKAYNNRWYGGGQKEFKGDFIPDFATVQQSIFKDSLLGPFIKDDLSMLLISQETGAVKPPEKKPVVTIH